MVDQDAFMEIDQQSVYGLTLSKATFWITFWPDGGSIPGFGRQQVFVFCSLFRASFLPSASSFHLSCDGHLVGSSRCPDAALFGLLFRFT